MPGGSIELLYCEKCGGLILGGAKNAVPAGDFFYCKKCSAAAPKGETVPVLTPASRETKEIPKRRLSSASMQPARRESGAANNRSKVLEPQSRSKRQTGVIPTHKEAGNAKMVYGSVAAGAVLLILGVSMLGGSSKPETHTAATKIDNSVREPAKPAERREIEKPKEAEKAVLPMARSEPAPAPAPVQTQKAEPAPQQAVETESEKVPAEPAPAEAKQRDPATMEERPAPKAPTATGSNPQTEAAREEAPSGKKPDAAEEDLGKPATPARAPSNPFSVAEGGEDPTKVMPGQKPAQPAPPAAAKPKPAYEKGKQSPLFPADRDSRTVDHQSPAMTQGQKSGIPESKYDGWSWMGSKLDGWNVKSGVLSMNTQGVLTLDGYPSKQFELSFEADLGAGGALAIHAGSSKNGINLIMFVPNGVMTGVWDQTKTKDNVKGNSKEGKPFNFANGFVPVKVQVAQGNVEVFSGGKSIFKGPLPNAPEFGQFGIMCLGVNGSTSPSLKLRNVTLFTP
ncbi:MAG: hypothetical protein KIS92_17665 [Planctomycetota bacterium]|nr:hypothetical protein [Planctomycetota bacterium]